ncbi:hypothetical protein GCM10010145_64390 [Streptomyces ruber]|uniref:Uncharacterized protein n=2 Tax=Streptomyces TaxID=1883 RepID=A0A918BQM9_9ACTN|nr:hypothetical protein [Streptomyces ruber]GGQ86083.1 hypothetical protein GCM10010145_64390 [Streptomyces ruber]
MLPALGTAVAPAPADAGADVPVRRSGSPEQFPAHAGRGDVPAGPGPTPVKSAGRSSACPATVDELAEERTV